MAAAYKQKWAAITAMSVGLAAGCAPLDLEGSGSANNGSAAMSDDQRTAQAGSRARTSSTSASSRGSAGARALDSGDAPTENDGTLHCPQQLPPVVTMEASGRAEGHVTWSGVVHVTADFSLRGDGKLSIAPGTHIFVEPDVMIEVGWNSSKHMIDAQGSEKAPIKFCRASPAGGNWRGLDLGGAVVSESTLKYVVIEGAGSMESPALWARSGILIDHVWVRDSANHGVRAGDFRDDSAALTVTGSKLAPLMLDGPWAVERLPVDSILTGNTDDTAHLSFANIDVGVQFRNIGIPYQLDKGLSLRGAGRLVVDPGVEWRVGLDQIVELGWNSTQVEVHLDGTAESPIVIRGVSERPGSWRGMSIESKVVSTSTLKFVHVLHGGGSDGFGLSFGAAVLASDLTFQDNAHTAFRISNPGLQPGSARFTVTGTKGSAGLLEADALTSLPAGGSYKGNQNDYIEVSGGTIKRSGTIPEVDVPLHVTQVLRLQEAVKLEIAPGVEFQMQSGASWDIGWNTQPATLKAVGTSDKPIKFRGISEQPGFWGGILIERNVTTDSRLEHVHIGNAGGGSASGSNLRLDASITVTDCRVYGSSGYGISAQKGIMQPYETVNTFEANATGDIERR